MTIVPDSKASQMPEQLADQERKLLTFLVQFHEEKQYAPSHVEAGKSLGWSPALVRWYMKRLVAKGFVRAIPGSPRAITVLRRE